MSKKILVVDDSPTDRTNLCQILQQAGHTVFSAMNGKEAIAKAKAERPDVIFLDVIMPEMDGYATCRTLISDPATKQIPIVFVTSKSQKADKVWAQMQGGKGYVTKPYTAEQINSQLSSVG
jgi:twitching motility two-component system response regulator PilH